MRKFELVHYASIGELESGDEDGVGEGGGGAGNYRREEVVSIALGGRKKRRARSGGCANNVKMGTWVWVLRK